MTTDDRPLVSIIIPNYNYARTLGMCLRAALNQTYGPVEILVVDDGSTDDSVAIAKGLGVSVISTPANGGCAAARNFGVARAAGEVLFFIDSDVAIAPDAVEVAVAQLRSDPRIGVICGIEDPEPLIRDSLLEEYRALQYHYWSVSGEGNVTFLFPAMCAMRREVFDEIGPFNTRLRHTEEVDYGYRVSRRYDLRLTSAISGRHDHDDSLRVLLRKLFHRGRMRIPLYARARAFAQGFETRWRAYGSVAALAALVSVVVPAVFGAVWWVVPALLFAVSVLCDVGLYAFVARRRSVAFLGYFVAIHFLVNVTIAAAAATGVLQWLTSGTFRRLYDPGPGGVLEEAGA
ncbi:glycosyltransferase family 2 protein [Actinoallomurus sp. CA-150999]|uniref:glycosyltransferase family 2 protein n=1 Tax=Actinoallomurus sp. CA-150999 TaxID=3239887 RepID=UPI003D8F8068